MKICLINPPTIDLSETRGLCSHLGLGYIAATLRKAGHEVDLFDCPIENITLKQINKKIRDENYKAIGISTYFYNYHNVLRIVKKIKKLSDDIFVFIGGYLPTLSYERIGKDLHEVDCMVIGEGEITTLELIREIATGNWRDVRGIAYVDKKTDKVIFTGKRKLVNELDSLPFPVRVVQPNVIELDVITSRGCYGRCSFCAIGGYNEKCIGKIVRRRIPEKVVDEIEYLLKKYNIEWINFADDCFSIASKENSQWFDHFIYLIKQRNIKLKYSCFIRADEIIQSIEKIKEFMNIGLSFIFVGIESLIQNHLDFYNKKITVQQNIKALKILDELEVTYNIGYILFNPITSMDDINKTIEIFEAVNFNRKNKNIILPISSSSLTAVDGSQFHKYVKENGIEANNKRGYIIKNEQVELCYQVMKKWSKSYESIISRYYIEKMATDLNENTIIEELKLVFYKMFYMDLQILKEVASSIKDGNCKYIDDFNNLLTKWTRPLAELENKVLALENKIIDLTK